MLAGIGYTVGVEVGVVIIKVKTAAAVGGGRRRRKSSSRILTTRIIVARTVASRLNSNSQSS